MCFDFTLEQEEENEDEAVEECKKQLSEYGAEDSLTDLRILGDPFGHICIYVNPDEITKDHIEMVDEVKDD